MLEQYPCIPTLLFPMYIIRRQEVTSWLVNQRCWLFDKWPRDSLHRSPKREIMREHKEEERLKQTINLNLTQNGSRQICDRWTSLWYRVIFTCRCRIESSIKTCWMSALSSELHCQSNCKRRPSGSCAEMPPLVWVSFRISLPGSSKARKQAEFLQQNFRKIAS